MAGSMILPQVVEASSRQIEQKSIVHPWWLLVQTIGRIVVPDPYLSAPFETLECPILKIVIASIIFCESEQEKKNRRALIVPKL